jgi:hypothetical protein
MTTTKSYLEDKALAWKESGKETRTLLTGWYFFSAYCWQSSAGAKQEGMSSELQEYLDACFQENGGSDGWSTLLRQRDSCDRCGEGYHLENLSVCTHCNTFYCYRCSPIDSYTNGNRACGCGGEVVG